MNNKNNTKKRTKRIHKKQKTERNIKITNTKTTKKLNIILVGTSHVSKDSIQKLKTNFFNYKPKIVCVELDSLRAKQLFSKKRKTSNFEAIKQFGLFGGSFIILGALIQNKLGKKFNMLPGEEMKQAIIISQKTNSKTYLIDKNIKQTIQGISKIPLFEKLKIFFDILFSLISIPFIKIYSTFSKNKNKDIYSFDASKVPNDGIIEKIMELFKKRYPYLYSELITKRNEYMVKKIITISKLEEKGNILVVIGAGHKKGMLTLLKSNPISKKYNIL